MNDKSIWSGAKADYVASGQQPAWEYLTPEQRDAHYAKRKAALAYVKGNIDTALRAEMPVELLEEMSEAGIDTPVSGDALVRL